MEKSVLKEHGEKTRIRLGYSVAGVTFPFVLSLIGIFLIKKYEYILSFLDDGQFLIFSTGLLTSALYIFRDNESQKNLKKSLFKFDRLLGHLIYSLLIITSAMYAIMYTVGIMHVSIDLNIWFIRVTSILFFSLSIYVLFRSIYVDFLKEHPGVNIEKERKKEINKIMNEL